MTQNPEIDYYLPGTVEAINQKSLSKGGTQWGFLIRQSPKEEPKWYNTIVAEVGNKVVKGGQYNFGIKLNGKYENIVTAGNMEQGSAKAPMYDGRPDDDVSTETSIARNTERATRNGTDDSILRQKALMEARLLLADMMQWEQCHPNGMEDAIDIVVKAAQAFYGSFLRG